MSDLVEVTEHQIVVGDVIMEYMHGDPDLTGVWHKPYDTVSRANGWTVTEIAGSAIRQADGPIRIFDGQTMKFRIKPRASDSRAAVKKSDSAWNDKCRVCYRRIYVGFMTVEHEGGGCGRI